jgi:hypothetical protein
MESFIESIRHKAGFFQPIDLKGMDTIQLLNRIDSKYVFHVKHFPDMLSQIREQYKVLDIADNRLFKYETIYFDTPDRLLYRMHHSGRPNRFKVRVRHYVDTGEKYFETKYKIKTNRTLKIRKKIQHEFQGVEDPLFDLVSWGRWGRRPVEQVLQVDFFRLTLASVHPPERITLDFNVTFFNAEKRVTLDDLVVVEIKQDKSNIFSPFLQALKKYHLEQVGFSKYSSGVALLETIKHNAFKPNFIKIAKITGQTFAA